MKAFSDVSLRTKLRTVIMTTSGVALVLVCAAFLAYEWVSFKQATSHRLEAYASMLSNKGSLAVASGESEVKFLTGLVNSLSSDINVHSAMIYGKNRQLLAHYSREATLTPPRQEPESPAGFRAPKGQLVISKEVLEEGERVGTVYLMSDFPESMSRLRTNLGIAGIILILTAAIAFLLSARFERVIIGPISHLAEIINKVTLERDYTARAEKHGQDELGVLIDGLNDMLSQIQVRDGALQLARNELELRVDERTAQLTFLNEEMKNEVAERKRAEDSMRESEERYRQLVELSPDAIVIHSAGRFVYVNSAAVALFAAKSPAQLVGRSVLEVVAPEHRGEMAGRIRKVYEGNVRTPLNEEKIVRLDGAVLDVETAALSFTYQGQPAAQVIIRDITQRKEVERMKNEFVSTVSHELRTPITSIQGSLGLIANGVMGAIPPAAKPLVDIAYKNCQRLVTLINDILDMEKIAAGKMKFALKPVEVGPLVEQTIDANRAFGAQFDVAFALRNDAPGCRVNADNDRLIQVVTNLLSNAAKFSPRGGTVDVTVSERDGWVRLDVTDHGPGIPEEFRKRIFQKFSQADSSDMRQKGGTGLGLAICRTIVDKHGGKVYFESQTGKGTTFTVELPLYEEAQPDVQSPKPSSPHVLICEDDPQVAAFIRLVLSKEGFQSDFAGDTVQARKMLADNHYDAMTLDLMLPDRDGISFLEELRTQEPTRHLPVIVVSAVASSHPDLLKGTALQVVDCLDKPIDAQRLLAAARMAVRSRGAAAARILHVEQDADIRQRVSHTLRNVALTTGAASLAEARTNLEKGAFDLVLLNVQLPDGPGTDLIPLLNGPGRSPVPVVFFNAQKGDPGGTSLLASTLLKSLAAQPELPESIQSWVREGTLDNLQGAKP